MINLLLISLIFHSIWFLVYYCTLKFVHQNSFTSKVLRFFVNNAVARIFIKTIFVMIGLSFFSAHHIVLAVEPDDIVQDTSVSIFWSYGKTLGYYTGVTLCVTAVTAFSGWFLSNIVAIADMGVNAHPTIIDKPISSDQRALIEFATSCPYQQPQKPELSHMMETLLAADINYAAQGITKLLEPKGYINPLKDYNDIMNIINTYNTIDQQNVEHLLRIGLRLGNVTNSNLPGDIHIKFASCMLVWDKCNFYTNQYLYNNPFNDPSIEDTFYRNYAEQRVKALNALLNM